MSGGTLEGSDDVVLPFAVEPLDIRGRAVRLGEAVDALLARHAYPDPVARAVGEAAALTALLGASLKLAGRFQLQTKSDGPLSMLVVDFDAPDRLRAYARFDAERLAALGPQPRSGDLLGDGILAMTVDQGSDASRYQGVVALDGQGFAEAAHQYFRQSEQIPTRVKLAVAEEFAGGRRRYRAGGILIQFLPASPERARAADLPPGDRPGGDLDTADADEPPEDDAWTEAKALVATVEDHELVDPQVSSERLLYRLFHERGVRVFEPQPVREACRCSRDRIMSMMRNFSAGDRHDMIGDDGRIRVTCEFCSRSYDLDPAEVEAEMGAGAGEPG